MAYDAPYQAKRLLVSIAETQLPAKLAEVCTERGIRVEPPRKVYDYVVPTQDLGNVNEFPFAEVMQLEGEVEPGPDTAATNFSAWVLATVRCGSLAQLTTDSEAMLAALCRAYAYGEGHTGTHAYEYALAQFTTSPPSDTSDRNKLQTVGIRVIGTITADY